MCFPFVIPNLFWSSNQVHPKEDLTTGYRTSICRPVYYLPAIIWRSSNPTHPHCVEEPQSYPDWTQSNALPWNAVQREWYRLHSLHSHPWLLTPQDPQPIGWFAAESSSLLLVGSANTCLLQSFLVKNNQLPSVQGIPSSYEGSSYLLSSVFEWIGVNGSLLIRVKNIPHHSSTRNKCRWSCIESQIIGRYHRCRIPNLPLKFNFRNRRNHNRLPRFCGRTLCLMNRLRNRCRKKSLQTLNQMVNKIHLLLRRKCIRKHHDIGLNHIRHNFLLRSVHFCRLLQITVL